MAGFSALLNLLMLTGSVYMLQVYDRVLTSGSVPTLFGLFAIVIILYAFLGFYDFLRARMLSRAGLRLDHAVAAPAFRAWLQSGLGRKGPQGEPLDAPMRDMETVRGFAASPGAAVLFDLPFVPLFIGVLFLLHPWLGWATLAGAGLAMSLALVGRWLTESGLAKAASLDAKPRELAERGRQSAETVLAMGMEAALTPRWEGLRNQALRAGQGTGQVVEALASGSRSFRMLLQSAILTLGAYLTLQGQITAGMIIAASILSGRALAPIDQAVGQAKAIARAGAAHRRLKHFSAAIGDSPAEIALPDPEGQLTVEDLVHFVPMRPGMPQEADRKRILSDVAFRLEPGDALGVVGPSASGKSTLARLLVHARAPDGGTVRLDGATLDQYTSKRLARHVGYLPQRVDLLPGTVRDNIARFDAEATDEAVIAAARAAGVHDMILALPEGYATEIEAGQTLLSGGQVQRIGLARALFGDPVLVVLDEPNAHLDQAGDNALTQAVERLRSRGSAVVIMAHRPSALSAVNKMMVLERGRVAAFGDKREVLDLIAPTPARTNSAKPQAVPAAAAQQGPIRFRKQNAEIKLMAGRAATAAAQATSQTANPVPSDPATAGKAPPQKNKTQGIMSTAKEQMRARAEQKAAPAAQQTGARTSPAPQGKPQSTAQSPSALRAAPPQGATPAPAAGQRPTAAKTTAPPPSSASAPNSASVQTAAAPATAASGIPSSRRRMLSSQIAAARRECAR